MVILIVVLLSLVGIIVGIIGFMVIDVWKEQFFVWRFFDWLENRRRRNEIRRTRP